MSDLSFEVRAPLAIELATGETVTIPHWSLQGFTFPGDSDVLPREAILSIPFQGVDIRFPVTLLRKDKTRFLTFDGLTGRQRETLAVFYRSILSGKMASTEEVITSLDTPVDLVPMEETEEERIEATTGKTPRSLRMVGSVLLYLGLAVLVFWTLGSGIYSKVSTVAIENARIEAPMVDHTAAQGGYVEEITVAPGATVSAGDILIRITTPDGETAMAEVRARITSLERRLEDARNREARLAQRIDTVRAALEAALNEATLGTMALHLAALEAFDGRWSAAHMDLFEAHLSARREIDTLEDELRRARRERGRIGQAREALHVMATVDGVVRDISVLPGQFIGRGAPVAIIEGTTARQARGWLGQHMAASIRPGMQVAATINAGTGRERLTGTVTAVEAGIDPALSPEFGMIVTVAFPDLSVEETRSDLPHLMPVALEAQRAWAVRFADRLSAVADRIRGAF